MKEELNDPNVSAATDNPAACHAKSGCTCSTEDGRCAACRRTHRLASGLVAAMAAITAGAWLIVWLLDR